MSNSCLKCQLISIFEQRGIKLTCAAEEPATTTPWLQSLHQQLLSPEEKPETLSSFVFCSVLAFSDTQHYHLPIHVDDDIPSLVWWIQRNIDGTLWCILYHMNPSQLHFFMRTRHYSKHCHKFNDSSNNSIWKPEWSLINTPEAIDSVHLNKKPSFVFSKHPFQGPADIKQAYVI